MWARFPANFSGVFMGPKPIIPGSGELFRQTLREQINLKHPLVKLADLIEWGTHRCGVCQSFHVRTWPPGYLAATDRRSAVSATRV